MSRVFNAYYFSLPDGEWERMQEDELNAEYELHEAKQELDNGINTDNLFEFIWFDEKEVRCI